MENVKVKRKLCRLLLAFALSISILLVGLVSEAPARQKTDVVILKNGDHLTGEVKGLEFARLSFKTDTMETVSIKWVEVEQVTSDYSFEVVLQNGLRYFGTLGASAEPGMLTVVGKDRTVGLSMDQVIRVRPIKQRFWKRINGSLSLGLSFTKASDVLRFSFNSDASYTERKNIVELTLSSIITTQQEQDARQNNNLNLRYNRLLEQKWFLSALTSLQRNDELGIKLRVLGGGGGGRLLVQTNRMVLPVMAGITVSRELAGSEGQDSTNVEGLVSIYWNLYIYHTPKTDLSFDLMTHPSITEGGRVRMNLDTRLRREIIKDFFVDQSFYLKYDNRPPSATASTTDYGFVTSVGYSF